jgi:hypothetical protein
MFLNGQFRSRKYATPVKSLDKDAAKETGSSG